MLPDEEPRARLLSEQLSGEFGFARRLLSFGVARCECGGHVAPEGIDELVLKLALGLWAKLCKQFRSVIALCELGLPEDGDTIARSEFEAGMALHFVLLPKLTLRENGKKVQLPGPFSRVQRACLYAAHSVFAALIV